MLTFCIVAYYQLDYLKQIVDYNVKPIDLNFKPSLILSAVIFLMGAMSSWIICLLNLPLLVQCLTLLIIWLATLYAIAGDGFLLYAWSPVRLYINTKNELNIVRKNGQILSDLSLINDSVVTPLLTIVHFQPKSATWYQRLFNQRLVILPDCVDAESYRQLRVWLLWGHSRKQR